MATRKVIKIDESKCNGCGLCVPSCAEGAIQIIDGKARLVADKFCDGLGACLGECPLGALTIEEREADAFDEAAVAAALGHAPHGAPAPKPAHAHHPSGGGCPGSRMLDRRPATTTPSSDDPGTRPSRLGQWPVQLHLVSPAAPYFQGADVLLAADCVAFAVGDFHKDWLAGRSLAIACPKLDDGAAHLEKLTAILRANDLRGITVARMEVPCCSGLTRLAQQAMAAAGKTIPLREVVVTLRGELPKTL